MLKQPYPSSNPAEFDEAAFIKSAEAAQAELLTGARQYLFDLQEHIKGLKGNMEASISKSADFFSSAIYCAAGGYVPDARLYLSEAKRFNHDIPESIVSSLMDAARLGGLRNFIKYLHVCNS